MKKFLLLIAFFALGKMGFGQELDFTFSKDSTILNGGKSYLLKVDVTKGSGPFGYIIYKGEPWNNNIIQKSEIDITSTHFIISGLVTKGNYFILLYLQQDKKLVALKLIKL